MWFFNVLSGIITAMFGYGYFGVAGAVGGFLIGFFLLIIVFEIDLN